jgi:hypothetical protein
MDLFARREHQGPKDESSPADKECSISFAFRHVHRFILEAVKGDRSAANTLFQKYFSGELPEELLAISRYYVQQDQKAEISITVIVSRCCGTRGTSACTDCDLDSSVRYGR